MKLRKIKVPEFMNSDDFGSYKVRDVEILFNPEENEITPQNFDQESHVYFLDSKEIERLSRETAQRFYDENVSALLSGERDLNEKEIYAIKSLLKVSGTDLGDLIGLDKSSISRIFSGKQELQKDKLMLLLERFKDELEHPGKSKITLHHMREKTSFSSNIEQVCLSAFLIGEFFIRRFLGTEGPITNLKLQKLLYYAQGIGFGRANLKLIKEEFLAWDHGPVIREIYDNYKAYGANPLPRDESLDISEVQSNELIVSLLEETVSLYGIYDAWYLRDRTHNEAPWAETPRDGVISDEKIIRFFKKALV